MHKVFLKEEGYTRMVKLILIPQVSGKGVGEIG
jgi:hypothetical protein